MDKDFKKQESAEAAHGSTGPGPDVHDAMMKGHTHSGSEHGSDGIGREKGASKVPAQLHKDDAHGEKPGASKKPETPKNTGARGYGAER